MHRNLLIIALMGMFGWASPRSGAPRVVGLSGDLHFEKEWYFTTYYTIGLDRKVVQVRYPVRFRSPNVLKELEQFDTFEGKVIPNVELRGLLKLDGGRYVYEVVRFERNNRPDGEWTKSESRFPPGRFIIQLSIKAQGEEAQEVLKQAREVLNVFLNEDDRVEFRGYRPYGVNSKTGENVVDEYVRSRFSRTYLERLLQDLKLPKGVSISVHYRNLSDID